MGFWARCRQNEFSEVSPGVSQFRRVAYCVSRPLTVREGVLFRIINKRVLIAGVIAAGLCVLGILAYHSQAGRTLFGIPTIVVKNDSGSELIDVSIVLSTSQSTTITRAYSRIGKDRSESIETETSDLQVDSIDYVLNGIKRSYTGGGLACPGEELVVSIGSNGAVTTQYEL